MLAYARPAIKEAEGYRSAPYRDTEGLWTVGYGHLLDQSLPLTAIKAMQLSQAEADDLFERDLAEAVRLAQGFDWFDGLDPIRQAVIVELCFQLGNRFRDFKRTIWAIKERRFADAAQHLRDSKAGRVQTPRRYRRLAQQLETGVVAS